MKIRFLIHNLVLALALSASLLANQVPQGYRVIECAIKPMVAKSEHISHPHIPGPKVLDKSIPKNQATSTNWSGYVAAGNLTSPVQNTVTAVYGSWIVPTVKATPGNTYCAYWVGIDGYSSPTVEQIGTSHNYINGAVQNYAWFEMYPGGSYQINGFPLNPGDVISASVVYSGNNVFTMYLYNDTQKVTTAIPTHYTTSATAKRLCAEWIVEAPYMNAILPLSNFGTAYLWGCLATINGVAATLNNNSWQNSSLEMITNNSVPKAIPSTVLQDNASFFVTWQHS